MQFPTKTIHCCILKLPMNEKIKNIMGKKDNESSQVPPEDPPPYSEGANYGPNVPNAEFLPPHEHHGSNEYPDEKKSGAFEGPLSSNNSYQGPGYDPMQDPNVIKVKPNMVNISQARPEHLNPSYPEFQARENERWKQGNTPIPREYYKHGAPLAPGHQGSSKTGGGAFPGSLGASYNNAARR